jgi:hypothetical protein
LIAWDGNDFGVRFESACGTCWGNVQRKWHELAAFFDRAKPNVRIRGHNPEFLAKVRDLIAEYGIHTLDIGYLGPRQGLFGTPCSRTPPGSHITLGDI